MRNDQQLKKKYPIKLKVIFGKFDTHFPPFNAYQMKPESAVENIVHKLNFD